MAANIERDGEASGVAASLDSPLFSTEPVVHAPRRDPLIVVGLPRSGSSFLAHVLSTLEDWHVFDDLYLHREASAVGARGPLTSEQLERLVDFLGWQVRARIMWPKFAPPRCSLPDVDRLCEATLRALRDREVDWPGLLEEWMTRLALHHGRSRWGYKAPQEFLNLARLETIFPGLRLIFLFRDPRDVMASLKSVRREDGRPAQYHPLVYATYWRMAARRFADAQKRLGDRVLRVRFEDLVRDPEEEAQRLARFLDTRPCDPIDASAPNTSFGGAKRKAITPTEDWLCERIAGAEMRALGYARRSPRIRIRDLPSLAWITLRFAGFQLHRSVRKQSARHSMKAFLRELFKPRRRDEAPQVVA